jgi:hypothetical protein
MPDVKDWAVSRRGKRRNFLWSKVKLDVPVSNHHTPLPQPSDRTIDIVPNAAV